ncbi:MAG: T9SS type A sorting domain-containing protein [Ignavibacteriaceae bacterium]
MAIGSKWVYSTNTANFDLFPTYYNGTSKREVLKDTLLSNGKQYFKIYDNTTLNSTKIFYERIDTSTGLVYRFDEESSGDSHEYLIDDLLSEAGDTISSYRDRIPYSDSNFGNVCVEVGSTNLFGQIRAKKSFVKFDLSGYSYSLVNGIGVDSIYNSWDFGYSLSKIKGCILNGVVYGDTTITDVEKNTDLIPGEYKLEQNYPNPFNPSTTITYQLPNSSKVTLKVFDVLGEELITLVDEYKDSGKYEVQFNASDLPSGVYFYRIRSGNLIETKKMILLK